MCGATGLMVGSHRPYRLTGSREKIGPGIPVYSQPQAHERVTIEMRSPVDGSKGQLATMRSGVGFFAGSRHASDNTCQGNVVSARMNTGLKLKGLCLPEIRIAS